MLADRNLASKYPRLDKYTAPVKKPEREIIGRDMEMRRILAAFHRPELSNVMLVGEAGSGKAHPNDTVIAVADERGYVTFGELKVGDWVFGEDGKPVEIKGVFSQGNKHVYRVMFADGTYVDCNDEHLWAVRTRSQHYKGSPYQVKTLRGLMNYGVKSPYIRNGRNASEHCNWYIPCNMPVERPVRDYKIHPYALGAFIGDGALTDRPLVLSSNDEAIVYRIADLIGAAGVEQRQHNYGWQFLRQEKNGHALKFIQTHELGSLLSDNTVFGRKSIDRRIPKEYFLGSIEQRYELLRGLMDTDGTVTGNNRLNCGFNTNNKGLADDVRELAASLGIRTTLTTNVRHGDMHINDEYEVHFVLPDDKKLDLFWLERHKQKILQYARTDRKFNKHYDDIAITDVIDLGYETEMTCIYVDSDSHLYQVGREHIVTHNTALVQGTMMKDKSRIYMEVDLSRMIADVSDANEVAAELKLLFEETAAFGKSEGKELVLFIDEFHQIVQISPSAVEVLKPLLADSGSRGIRVIAATTYVEFREYISPNQPLVERLQRINLTQPNKEMTINILRGMAKRYGVLNQFPNDHIFEMIYEYTNRYIPANSQPRKSIIVLDSMVGWYRAEHRRMDMKLLADVIYESEGVNVAFRVDATSIKQELDKHVLSQEFATSVIEERLQICVADLNNKSKPMSSFLFTGSTGVGKTEMTKQLARILFEDDRNLIRFDMTEFANQDSLERFRTELTARVWERPYSVILLDEIEKACAPVTRILLQVLDDGRLMDENNREVSFSNAYIIMTTNAGSEIYQTIAQYGVDNTGSGQVMKKYNKLIRESISSTSGDNKFPPELLGRIDTIVPFQPLSEETMKKIVEMKLRKLKDEVWKKHNVELRLHPKIIRYLVEDNLDTDSNSGGARIVMSKLETEVTTAVARFINAHPNVPVIGVKVEGELAADHKNKLQSEAYIKVVATR